MRAELTGKIRTAACLLPQKALFQKKFPGN